MRKQMTMKSIKASNDIVLGVGYGDMQNILRYEQSPAYAVRQEGWACDVFHISDRYSIATGYDTQRSSTHSVLAYRPLMEELDAYEKSLQGDISENGSERMAKLIEILDKHLANV